MTTVIWNRKLTELVISLYRDHPCLWDQEHGDYQDRDVRDEAFNTIAVAMNEDIEGISVNDIKLKIKSIKSQLRKEIKTIEESIDAGITPDKIKAPRLWCYDLVEFLVPNTGIIRSSPRKTGFKKETTNKRELVDDLEDDPDFEPSTSQASINTSIAKRQKVDDDAIKKELQELRNSLSVAAPRRFEWVGEQVVSTLNEMNNEEIIDDCIEYLQLIIMKFKKKDRTSTDILGTLTEDF